MSQNPSPKMETDGGGGGGNNFKEDNHDCGQDRDKWHSDSYLYNPDYVQIFDSIGIIKPYASHNRALDGVGWGR